MRVVVVGSGIAGLASARALADQGHDVVVLERDPTPAPASPAEAFEWDRRGAPQVRHSHAFLARTRNVLAARASDVLADVLAAGATEIRFTDALPDTLTDRDPRPGDDELVALACRRTTFEMVLRRAVTRDPRVTLRDGVVVRGLSAHQGGSRTTIVGVLTDEGVVTADLVVDATGPRTGSGQWLADAGVDEPPPREHDTGIVYLSRFYALRDGHGAPPVGGPVVGDLGYAKFAVFVGDNRTFSITLAVDVDDADLRRALLDPSGFEAAVATLEPARPWRDGRSTPLTDVHVMAGLRNRWRTFVVDGEPIALGYLAVGDAAVCTNPLYGRGCSLALVHAFALGDVVAEHAGDPRATALAFADVTERELGPWYRAAVLQDREGRNLFGGSSASDTGEPEAASDDPRAWARAIFQQGLLPAMRTSPVVFRAFLRWFNLLATPDALVNDPEVVGEALRSYERRAEHVPLPPVGLPTRDAFLAALGQ